MVLDTDNVFFKTIAPSFGIFVAQLLFLAPLRAVIRSVRSNELGALCPLPFPFFIGNCAGWLAYSMVMGDYYIFFANYFGLCLGVFYTMATYPLATPQMRKVLMFFVLLFTVVISTVGFGGVMAELEQAKLQQLWGLTANIILVMFYSAPLTSVWNTIRTRDASSIHVPLAIMSLVNGSLWFFYGMAMSDEYVWIPNTVGATFGALNLVLKLVFPAHKSRAAVTAALIPGVGEAGAARDENCAPVNDVEMGGLTELDIAAIAALDDVKTVEMGAGPAADVTLVDIEAPVPDVALAALPLDTTETGSVCRLINMGGATVPHAALPPLTLDADTGAVAQLVDGAAVPAPAAATAPVPLRQTSATVAEFIEAVTGPNVTLATLRLDADTGAGVSDSAAGANICGAVGFRGMSLP